MTLYVRDCRAKTLRLIPVKRFDWHRPRKRKKEGRKGLTCWWRGFTWSKGIKVGYHPIPSLLMGSRIYWRSGNWKSSAKRTNTNKNKHACMTVPLSVVLISLFFRSPPQIEEHFTELFARLHLDFLKLKKRWLEILLLLSLSLWETK